MKKYNELDMEFVALNSADVLTASITGSNGTENNGGCGGSHSWSWSWIWKWPKW